MVYMNKSDYKFGIKKRLGGRWGKTFAICNCGQGVLYNKDERKYSCDKCLNEYFVNCENQTSKRFTIPYLEILRKDNRGFKVKRTNLSIIVEDNQITPVKENLTRIIDFDVVDNTLKVWRGEELEYDAQTHNSVIRKNTNTRFFTQLDESDFLEFVSNEVTRSLYTGVVSNLSREGASWQNKDNVLYGLELFASNHQYLQILANAGVPEVDRFFAGRYYHGRNNIIDKTKTKPHEILRVPKFIMQYVREDTSLNLDILRNFQNSLKQIDGNKFKEILSIVKDEGTLKELSSCIDNIMQIHKDYDYSNLKKLVLYLFREVRLTQGIDSPTNASTYLRDYIRMSRHLGLEYEKYPKSLKKVHDVAQLNYKAITAGKEKVMQFKMAVEKNSYQELAFMHKKEKYAIVIPDKSEDIVKEGNELSHCVASYVKDVIEDRCKIVFLRNKEDLDKPLATIEVRGFNIRQARGFSNARISEDQKEFIKLWAEEKRLIENYY
jgi:hypothetical protein